MTTIDYSSIKAGEIWWIDLSGKNRDTVGHETRKVRPGLVIGNCIETTMLMIIPFQSNLDAKRLPYTYTVKKQLENGLEKDSVAVIFQMRSIDYERIKKYSGVIEATDLGRIKNIIKDYLDL